MQTLPHKQKHGIADAGNDLLVPNLVGARRYFAMIFLFRKIIGIRAAAPPLPKNLAALRFSGTLYP